LASAVTTVPFAKMSSTATTESTPSLFLCMHGAFGQVRPGSSVRNWRVSHVTSAWSLKLAHPGSGTRSLLVAHKRTIFPAPRAAQHNDIDTIQQRAGAAQSCGILHFSTLSTTARSMGARGPSRFSTVVCEPSKVACGPSTVVCEQDDTRWIVDRPTRKVV
jgi:hypothetical protein